MYQGHCVVVLVFSRTGDEIFIITFAVFSCGYTDVLIFLIGDDGFGAKKNIFSFAIWIRGMISCCQMRGSAFIGFVLRAQRCFVCSDTWVGCCLRGRPNLREPPEADQSNGNDIWLKRASKTPTADGRRTMNIQMLRLCLVIYCLGLKAFLRSPEQMLPRVLSSARWMPCQTLTVRSEQQ